MLEIEKKTFIFKNKEIWFADRPFEVKGCDSVSFMSCKEKVESNGFIREDFSTLVLDLSQSIETLRASLDSGCRNQINRALREYVKTKIDTNYNEFYEINNSFRQKKGLAGKAILPEFMKKYGVLVTAEVDTDVVAGLFLLKDANNIRGSYAASKRLDMTREKANLVGYANRLLWWDAIRYAKEKGIREFDFGGYYTGENRGDPRVNINRFKKSYGGNLAVRYNYEKVYSTKCKCARSFSKIIRGVIKKK
jgi:lipid II:glycine glycyltransferase (peptidoglycan interpeptide bridge formation enzyme)